MREEEEDKRPDKKIWEIEDCTESLVHFEI